MWFRRDLRLSDNLALVAASEAGDEVLPLFVLDDRLWGPAGAPRRAQLVAGLRALDESLDGRLVVRHGDPVDEVPAVAREVAAEAVFATADFGPYGRERDEAVGEALRGAEVAFTCPDTPYVVAPGELRTKAGGAYKVFTPFFRAWSHEPHPVPVPAPRSVSWTVGVWGAGPPDAPDPGIDLPSAGEHAARRRLRRFVEHHLEGYADGRDRPATATSHLSPDLKWGFVHPRQVLHAVGAGPDAEKLAAELAWRELYAHVLFEWPESARQAFVSKMAAMRLNEGRTTDERFDRWVQGRTGYPLVDAGMRQLAQTAWMHNRVRMVVASFLVKDLHVDWTRGARLFMQRLVDGDLASNQHGWQWVAGTGTDAAPYFRVFNPVAQSKRFDPDGEYLRRWLPELADLPTKQVHEPWTCDGGPPNGYPDRIVQHAAEREEALARLAELG
jgi:deoxyribodipyrimidine photo-lyase